MTTINLTVFYLISIVVGVTIAGMIEAFKEIKQWKKAYDKQKRIERFMEEFEESMSNIESFDSDSPADEYLRKAILYD